MSTIEKALTLLEHFSSNRPEIGLTEFKTITSIDKGTLYRHLTALKNSGFLEQNYLTKRTVLGPAVIRLAAVRENTVPIVKTVQYYVDRIANEIHELVHARCHKKWYVGDLCKDGSIIKFVLTLMRRNFTISCYVIRSLHVSFS